MKSKDFLLSDQQLAHLNSMISASVEDHVKAGEDSFDGVSVIFDFSAFGRSIHLRCCGGPSQEVIDD